MTVCVLGSPTAFLPVLLEGGTRYPGEYGPVPPAQHPAAPPVRGDTATAHPVPPTGAMVLCLAPAWASRVPSETSPGSWSLLLSRGVSFEAGGCTALEEFVPPRRATYVTGTFGSEGSWEGELARDLDCPTGGSALLTRWLEDPLLSRWLLSARAGLPVPPTLAFITGLWETLPEEPEPPGVHLVRLQDPQGQESLVRDEVGAFLEGSSMQPYDQVGTAGGMWHNAGDGGGGGWGGDMVLWWSGTGWNSAGVEQDGVTWDKVTWCCVGQGRQGGAGWWHGVMWHRMGQGGTRCCEKGGMG